MKCKCGKSMKLDLYLQEFQCECGNIIKWQSYYQATRNLTDVTELERVEINHIQLGEI